MSGSEIGRAARAIRAGGIVAYPTESCYGLGCDPLNRAAVLRLLKLKRRPAAKGLILIAYDRAQLTRIARELPDAVRKSWPGPNTWLVTPTRRVPAWIRGRHPRVAVRVTAHPPAAALCRAAGIAIVSTSANRGGERPARDEHEVRRRFGDSIDYVVPGRIGTRRRPTPIIDAATQALIRHG